MDSMSRVSGSPSGTVKSAVNLVPKDILKDFRANGVLTGMLGSMAKTIHAGYKLGPDNAAAVKIVQRALIAWVNNGHPVSGGLSVGNDVNGAYDAKTIKTLAAFQAANGIDLMSEPDESGKSRRMASPGEMLGPETIKALQNYLIGRG